MAEQPELGVTRRATRPQVERQRRPAGLIAPVLSLIWPGLGQLYLGDRRRALLFAIPALLLALFVAYLLLANPEGIALRLLVPAYLIGAVALIGIDAVWRILAVVDAWWRAPAAAAAPSRSRTAPVVLLIALVIAGAHLWSASYLQAYTTATRPIFVGSGPTPAPPSQVAPGTPDPSGSPPVEDPLGDLLGDHLPTVDLGLGLDPGPGIPRDGPLAVLFVGVDSAPGRTHTLTDTLMVGTFDRVRNELVLVNVVRDLARMPLYNGGTYGERINSFLSYAREHPEEYPEGPIRALTNEIAYIVGIPIHYYAVVDMAGFEDLVNLVGGVDVTIDYTIADPVRNLYLGPGSYHLDGDLALRFVRSRYGPNNSDYRRARRQQQVIRAMADRLRDPTVAIRLPEIATQASRLARTNIPVENLEEFLSILDHVTDATPTRVVFQPPTFAKRIPPGEVGGRWMIEPRMDAIAARSIELFGEFSLYSRQQEPVPTDAIGQPAP